MTSDLYKKILQDVEDLLNNHPHGDIALKYVDLQLYGIQNEPDRIKYLKSIIRNHNGTAQRLGKRTAEAIEEFQRHTENMGYGDEEGAELP